MREESRKARHSRILHRRYQWGQGRKRRIAHVLNCSIVARIPIPNDPLRLFSPASKKNKQQTEKQTSHPVTIRETSHTQGPMRSDIVIEWQNVIV
jgi:hypothetical protein